MVVDYNEGLVADMALESTDKFTYILSVSERLPVVWKIYNTALWLLLRSCSGQRRTSLER